MHAWYDDKRIAMFDADPSFRSKRYLKGVRPIQKKLQSSMLIQSETKLNQNGSNKVKAWREQDRDHGVKKRKEWKGNELE